MIISASRRTDIPAFFSDWFYNRLRDGFVIVSNPYYPEQLSKLRLTSDMVDMIVFWTKNPRPMMARLDELDEAGLHCYFQFTLTPYDHDIEPNLPPKDELIETFKELSSRIGANKVIWRHDPILFTDEHDFGYHEQKFSEMCSVLSGVYKTLRHQLS